MKRSDILVKTIALFATMTDAEEITEESNLIDDLELSSMDVLFVISSLEEEFGIKIPEAMIRTTETVSDVVEIVCDMLK